MKTLFSFIFSITMLSVAAQNKSVYDGTAIGEAIKNEETFTVQQVLEMAAKGKKKEMTVRGKVSEVCQKKGCWMKLEASDGETMHVSFKNYALFMPKDLAGKEIVMVGRPYTSDTSVEELRHYAEDAGKSQEEIAKITAPKKEFRFEATGVVILSQ